jgi:hypothetical protein
MAKITVTTDKSGRKVYKVAGTKKYAYSMAKAREIAAKESGPAVRKSASTGRRARHGGHGSPEEGYFDTKARRGVRVKKAKPSAKYAAFEGELVHDVVDSLKGLASYKKAHAAFKKDAYKAAAKYGVNEDYISPSFTRKLLRELKSEIADLEGLAKSRPRITKAYAAPASKALRRPSKGGKKYSRQRTGRALYRGARRNPAPADAVLYVATPDGVHEIIGTDKGRQANGDRVIHIVYVENGRSSGGHDHLRTQLRSELPAVLRYLRQTEGRDYEVLRDTADVLSIRSSGSGKRLYYFPNPR